MTRRVRLTYNPTPEIRQIQSEMDELQHKWSKGRKAAANRAALEAAGFDLASFDANTRVTNVKQPWAHALVTGVKDVENRSTEIPRLPEIMLIVASKAAPKEADLARYYSLGGPPADFEGQAVIGAVEIVDNVRRSASPWFNPGGVGWVVGKYVQFPFPVEGVAGKQTPRLYLDRHDDRARILRELGF
jgi:hypothetical protein